MEKLTVFTATYNRVNTINRLYNSLLKQTCMDFEWLVIDDGSSDGTSEYVESLCKESKLFDIRYYRQTNGGKHRAINRGVELAKGEYFFIVDSDDYLTENSIELIISWLGTISDKDKQIVSVSGLRGYSRERIIGKTFSNCSFIDCTAIDRYKYNIYGDKSEVYKTSILKNYKFPEIDGETFISEALVWNRIAKDGYQTRYFNEINYICEYREDGITKRIDKLYSMNIKGYSLYVIELLSYKMSCAKKLKAIMAYGYRCRLNKIKYGILAKNIGVPVALLYFLSILGLFYKKLCGILRNSHSI